jgi:hypothetical protein
MSVNKHQTTTTISQMPEKIDQRKINQNRVWFATNVLQN